MLRVQSELSTSPIRAPLRSWIVVDIGVGGGFRAPHHTQYDRPAIAIIGTARDTIVKRLNFMGKNFSDLVVGMPCILLNR